MQVIKNNKLTNLIQSLSVIKSKIGFRLCVGYHSLADINDRRGAGLYIIDELKSELNYFYEQRMKPLIDKITEHLKLENLNFMCRNKTVNKRIVHAI